MRRGTGMARQIDGVRFRLFANWAIKPEACETVTLSLPAGMVGPGPADPWLFTVDAIGKQPYDPPRFTPPYRGARGMPALPDARGHFDAIAFDDPTFPSAHLYGAVRFALDVWEKYLGGAVRWRAADLHPRLELIPEVDWANAQSGAGFIETGALTTEEGRISPLCLNFDVIAHEVGHTILFAEMGVPPPERVTSEFLAFHEAMSDMSALIALMHFDGVLDDTLGQTHGNLYALNMLNRFGILSEHEQIRVSDNTRKMADVAGLRLAADGSWVDPLGERRNAHHLAAPLIGALFDLLVDVYQERLVADGIIAPALDARNWSRARAETELAALSAQFEDRFAAVEPLFREALVLARDVVGMSLARLFQTLVPDGLSFARVARAFLVCLGEVQPDADLIALAENFHWRGIEVGVGELTVSRRRGERPYAERVALARARRLRHDESAGSAGALHRLINHDHRGHSRTCV